VTWCDVTGYPPYAIQFNEVQCVLLPTRVRESKPRCRTTLFTLFSICRTSELIFMLWSPSRTVRRATSHELMLQHSYSAYGWCRLLAVCCSFGLSYIGIPVTCWKDTHSPVYICTFCRLSLPGRYVHGWETKEVWREIYRFDVRKSVHYHTVQIMTQ